MEQKVDIELKGLRRKIDQIDLKLLRLLEKRWETAKKIGKLKRKKGVRYYDKKREDEIIKRVTSKTHLDKKFIKKLFSNVMEYCRNGERK